MMLSFGLWLSAECAGLPSVVMWGDRGEVRYCDLRIRWYGGDGWTLSGDVISHARIYYGPNLRNRHPRTTGATTCSVWNSLHTNQGWCGKCTLLGWVGSGMVIRSGPHDARGVVVPRTIPGNLSIAMVPCTTSAKPGIWPIVNLCNGTWWSLGHTPKEV
jgi:hypothetical protein